MLSDQRFPLGGLYRLRVSRSYRSALSSGVVEWATARLRSSAHTVVLAHCRCQETADAARRQLKAPARRKLMAHQQITFAGPRQHALRCAMPNRRRGRPRGPAHKDGRQTLYAAINAVAGCMPEESLTKVARLVGEALYVPPAAHPHAEWIEVEFTFVT